MQPRFRQKPLQHSTFGTQNDPINWQQASGLGAVPPEARTMHASPGQQPALLVHPSVTAAQAH
jgi:hypothetical protein